MPADLPFAQKNIPGGLLELPKVLMRFVREDFGFTAPTADYVAQYKLDMREQAAWEDKNPGKKRPPTNAIKVVDGFLKAFLNLMELDLHEVAVYDSKGRLSKVADPMDPSNEITETKLRSKWIDDEAQNIRLSPMTPRIVERGWFDWVKKHWLELLPLIEFYNNVPDPRLGSFHTKEAIARKMNQFDPQRERALKFLVSQGFQASTPRNSRFLSEEPITAEEVVIEEGGEA